MSTNLWKLLQEALPGDSLRIGTIAVVHAGNNTVTCTMANGGSLTVRGTGTVGDVVYIRDGEVRDTASGLTTFADQDV
jgi:hypothetical protein